MDFPANGDRVLTFVSAQGDVFDLDCLRRVIDDALGCPHADRRWRIRFNEHLQQSRGRGGRSSIAMSVMPTSSSETRRSRPPRQRLQFRSSGARRAPCPAKSLSPLWGLIGDRTGKVEKQKRKPGIALAYKSPRSERLQAHIRPSGEQIPSRIMRRLR